MDISCTHTTNSSRQLLIQSAVRLICLLALIALNLIASTALFAQSEPARVCIDLTAQERATVKFITDGDSLTLTDGRKIRLIGLNAPELYPEPQPFADAARTRLRELVESGGNDVFLTSGPEPHDRHGRHLAHVMNEKGQMLAGELIRQGLAVQTSVVPNTHCAAHYAKLEQAARQAQRGLWKNDDFWRVSFKRLGATERGFRFIQDRVHGVQIKPWGTQLELKHGVVVEVDASITLRNATGQQLAPDSLKNRGIEVRGWLYRYRRQHRLKLHHTANFRLLDS